MLIGRAKFRWDCCDVQQPVSEHLNIKVTNNNNEVFFKIKRIRNALLWERQVSCTPFETNTEVVTLTSTVTSDSTMTETVTTSPSESEFSCPTMAVTNTAGDVLSLDDSCSLEFSPASTTSSNTTAGSTGAGSGNSSKKLAAISIYSHRVVAWRFTSGGFLVLLIL